MQGRSGSASQARPSGRVPEGSSLPALVLDRAAPEADRAPALDDDQRRVVHHRGGHLLVVAGPGTGKTTTLTELIVHWLAEEQARRGAERVLALTFGRRAASELAERVARRLGNGPQPVVSTFHAFAYGLVRQHADPAAFLAPPRLLTAAEQDARVSELLEHAVGEGRLRWPDDLAGAVGTRGIAEQVRLLMGRARAQGLDGKALAARGRAEGIGAWVAVGTFLEEYLDTLGFEGCMDYSDLIARATGLVAGSGRRASRIREFYDLIVVDEYQDTDPAQVRLLRHLARGGAHVVAVGDPDQAIYGFRGADVGGLLRFPEHFADPASGAAAGIVVLRTSRRFPRGLATAAHGVLGPAPLGPLPAAVQRMHRHPITADDPTEVSARTFPSTAAEAAGVADHLVRAHAGLGREKPLAWSQMAVLVRNPRLSAAVLARALRAAGVPVALPPDELALHQEAAVGVLTTVLALVVDGAAAHPTAGPELLTGPLGRVDPVTVRGLARAALRRPATGDLAAEPAADPSRRSDAALTAALVAGRLPHGAPAPPGFEAVRRAISAARGAVGRDAMVSEVLWAAWAATDWPQRLRRAALGSVVGPSPAHRDLDALVSLFGLASRLPSQLRGALGVRAFLDEVASLRLPAEGADRIDSGRDEVRLLSAHRAKGLEWELVVVAGVQEGTWPDLRLRSDLLAAGRLSAQGPADAPSVADLLAEERRLMYVACTRARSSLLVTAVAEPVDGGAEPSRFLRDLGVPVESAGSVRRTPVRVDALVAELRRAASAPVVRRADGTADPDVEALRGAAVSRLAVLASRAGTAAGAGPPGKGPTAALAHPCRPADPATWWGVTPLTGRRATPAVERLAVPGASTVEGPSRGSATRPVRLSPSSLEMLVTCPLRWFLERRAGAGVPAAGAATVGVLVHAVVRAVAEGHVAATPAAVAEIVDRLWPGVQFPAAYQRRNERDRVQRMLEAFLAWHVATGRVVVGTEAEFVLDLTGEDETVQIRGKVDRLDLTPDGRVRVVDYKTSRAAVSREKAASHAQLGVYQAAVRAGAFGGVPAQPGGAELVHLGDVDRHGLPRVRTQDPLTDGWTWVDGLVAEAGRLAAGPGYPARRNERCGSCSFHALCPVQSRPPRAPGGLGAASPAVEHRAGGSAP